MTKRAGKPYPRVIFASPGRQPPRVRHSASNSVPAARWIAPSTPPPPRSVVFAAFTIASTSSFVMSPRAISILLMIAYSNVILDMRRGVLIETKNHHSNTSSPINPSLRCSRRQPLDQPTATRLAIVTKAIVHAIRATLPEFDHIRFHSITAPMRRQRNAFVAEAFRHLGQARIEHAAPIENLALT